MRSTVFSSPDPDAGDALAARRALAERLWGRAVDRVDIVAAGANSHVCKAMAGDDCAALKLYPTTPGDDRDRLGVETAALRFLRGHGVASAPALIAADADAGAALFEWLDGAPFGEIDAQDVDDALAFLRTVAALSGAAGAQRFGLASEACLSPRRIETQVRGRLDRLSPSGDQEPSLRPALEKLNAAAARIFAAVDAAYAARKWPVDEDLPQDRRRLIPADFGFHNAMRAPDGRFRVFDLEYFGWDDPVKIAADLLLHPATTLGAAAHGRLRAGLGAAFGGGDPDFDERFAILYPAIALRWALIALNPFRVDRRPAAWAAAAAAGWSRERERRLALSDQFVAHAAQCVDGGAAAPPFAATAS